MNEIYFRKYSPAFFKLDDILTSSNKSENSNERTNRQTDGGIAQDLHFVDSISKYTLLLLLSYKKLKMLRAQLDLWQ